VTVALHHVSLEVPNADVERMVEFWELLGFRRLPAPEAIAPFVTWLERGANQIHLIHTDEAMVPGLGHPAVVAEQFDATIAALRSVGFAVEEAQELWGKPRAFAIAPAGHRVELMAAPPDPSG
jgi:catechol 2,3-dioxygenase-like lactoylglutathione lyase family enzyme